MIEPKLKMLQPSSWEHLDGEDLYRLSFSGSPQGELSIEDRTFEQCYFNDVDFQNIRFSGCDFVDCVFDHCLFFRSDFSSRLMCRVNFRDCKMLNADFSESVLENVLFENCLMRYANFSGTEIKNCTFDKTQCTDSYFERMKVKKWVLKDCDLSKGRIFSCHWEGTDLSSTALSDISIDANSLKGTILNEIQALAVVKLLGVEIKGVL